VVGAALVNAIIFGVGAAVTITGIGVILDPASRLPAWLTVVLLPLFTFMMWFALKPFRRLTAMTSHADPFGEAAGAMGTTSRRIGRSAKHVGAMAAASFTGNVAAGAVVGAGDNDDEDQDQPVPERAETRPGPEPPPSPPAAGSAPAAPAAPAALVGAHVQQAVQLSSAPTHTTGTEEPAAPSSARQPTDGPEVPGEPGPVVEPVAQSDRFERGPNETLSTAPAIEPDWRDGEEVYTIYRPDREADEGVRTFGRPDGEAGEER
jgi:hypothetical protein